MYAGRLIVLAAALVWVGGCRGRVSPMGGGGTLAPNDSGHGGAGTGGLVSSGDMDGTGGAGTGGSGGAILVYDRTLYGSGPGPRALYVDGNDLIWAEIAPQGPIVMRGPKNGSGPVTMLGTWLDGDRTFRLFTADADAIYWVRGWQIHRVRKSGEPLPPLEMGMGHVSGGGVISDGDNLWVADLGCTAIGRIPKNAVPPTFIVNPASRMEGGTTGLEVDADNVYCAYLFNIFVLPKASHTIETWVSDQEAAASPVVDETQLFWVNNRRILGTRTENLASTSKGSFRTSRVLTTLGDPAAIVIDIGRRSIYGFTGTRRGRLFSYSTETDTFNLILDNTPILGGFAHDENHIYWVSDTKIWRLPKDSIVPPAR